MQFGLGGFGVIAGHPTVVNDFPPVKLATAFLFTPPPFPPSSTTIASVTSIFPVPPRAVAWIVPGLEKSLRTSAPVRLMIASAAQSKPAPAAVKMMFSAMSMQAWESRRSASR